MNSLEDFYMRRKLVTATLSVATFQQSFLLGSSVIAGSLLQQYTPPYTYKFHGLYAISLSLFISYILGSEVLIPLLKQRPEWRKPISMVLVLLYPASFAIVGASISFNNNVALLYIALAGFMGISLAVYDVFTRLEVLQWWGVDGNKRIGVGIVGLVTGIGAIFYTLVSGWMIVYVSLQTCMYTLAGFQLILSAWIAYAVGTGGLDSPPSAEQIHQWMDESESEKETTSMELGRNNRKSSNETTSETFTSQLQLDMQEDNDDKPNARPVGTTALVPVVLTSRREGMQYPAVWLSALVIGLTSFNGYSTKVLLSSMFDLVFSLPKMTGAYLSALSLTVFLLARAIIPLYLMDSRYSSSIIMVIAAAISAVGYAVLPVTIGDGVYEPVFTWRLFGFVVVKSIIGGCFACLQVISSPMIYDLVGEANLPIVFRMCWPVAAVSGSSGPIVAFVIAASRFYGGMNYSQSFGIFFYIAAGLAVVNTLACSFLHIQLKRTKQQ